MASDDSTRGAVTSNVGGDPNWSARWRAALGPYWPHLLAFFFLCLFVAGASAPLSDPDLPIHLATGEWIVRHHAVPFIEPFAWTRAGQPFQAYSWAIETTYYLILASFGPIGLHALQGLVYIGFAFSIGVLGKVARWSPWTIIALALAQLLVAFGTSSYVRPQAVMLIATPISWALVLRARDVPRLRWELPALTLLSVVFANTHLLFPITAAPCVLLLSRLPHDRKRLLVIPAAIVVGWFVSPYALDWVAIYILNFGPNALYGPTSPISEYKPGFSSAMSAGFSWLTVGLALTVVPWFVASRYSVRERLLHGFLWFAGLLIFAIAVRGLVVWWLLAIPTVGAALELFPEVSLPALRLAQRGAVVAIFVSVALLGLDDLRDPWMRAGSIETRVLPSVNARSIEPIAQWLDCNVAPNSRGRLLTTFNFGGYVPWRLPYLSESIDGRTIFPDSVAKAETYFPPNSRTIPLPPWRTADLAIAPVYFPVAAVLDTAKGWRRIGLTSQMDGRAAMIGLWVSERWWLSAGRSPQPTRTLPLYHRPLDASLSRSATCEGIQPPAAQ
jgi:hypothetical protein